MNAWRGRRGMIIGGAFCVLALTLWGTFRFGTAAELFPEESPRPAARVIETRPREAQTPEPEPRTKKAELLYDATQHRRDTPLKDPFRVTAIAEGMKNVSRTETAAAGAARENLPVLRGTMRGAGGARAFFEIDGQSKTVKEGERVGAWTVVAIGKKEVVLSGPAGERTLSL